MGKPAVLHRIAGHRRRRKRMDVDAWKKLVEAGRRQKDMFFASHPQSPLSLHDRRAFQGLAYWPPDPEYCFELALHEYDAKEVIHVADTSGQQRNLWRWGQFRFQLAGKECTLQTYRSDPGEEQFFIPFRDQTSGNETYGAGRYLDLEPEHHLTSEGKWVVDFHEAYNPWCAYSEKYTCPIVPPENWLEVPIHAGEKTYKAPRKNSTVQG